jgi:hypothetical protein
MQTKVKQAKYNSTQKHSKTGSNIGIKRNSVIQEQDEDYDEIEVNPNNLLIPDSIGTGKKRSNADNYA